MISQDSTLQIVIVNWNAGNQLHDCLASIERFGSSSISSIIVVDNGSTDGSAEALEGRFDLPVRVISNKENRGFAAACNQGAVVGNAPYLLFLNPDTRLFEGALDSALAVFNTSEQLDIGIVGVQLLDEEGEVVRSCARFPQLSHFAALSLGLNKLPWWRSLGFSMKEWSHDETRDVDEVMGAFFLVRRDLYNRLNGFDERFFVYFEEVDFSLRANQVGYRSVYLAEAQVFHAGGGTSRQVKARRLFYSLRSRILYGFKHFPSHKAWILVALTALIEPVSRVGFCLFQRDWAGLGNTMKGYFMLYGEMISIIKRREGA